MSPSSAYMNQQVPFPCTSVAGVISIENKDFKKDVVWQHTDCCPMYVTLVQVCATESVLLADAESRD